MWWGATILSRNTQLCIELATVISLLSETRSKTLAPQLPPNDTQVQRLVYLCVWQWGIFRLSWNCGLVARLTEKREREEWRMDVSSSGINWKLSKPWDVGGKKAPKQAIIFLQFYEVISALIQKESNKTSYFKMLTWDRISFHAVVSAHFFD